MTPGRPRAGWKAWEPEIGSDAFYIGQDVPGPQAIPAEDVTHGAC